MKKILNLIAGLSALGMVSTQAATSYVGNGSSGFGGAVGNGSLVVDDNVAGVLSFTLTKGTSGALNDALVIYFDTISGGINNTSSLTDSADALRKATSGYNGSARSLLTFASGFSADYAIALKNDFAGLWSLSNAASLPWQTSANLQAVGGTGPNATSYTFSINASSLGLTANSGQTFSFFTTYLADSAWRSTETLGASYSGSPSAGHSAFTAAGSNSYTLIPEPSSSLLMGLGLAGLVALRLRRHRA